MRENIVLLFRLWINWDRNHQLGLIYEVPESDGNAIICASDLFSCKENVEVKALFESILSYLQNR